MGRVHPELEIHDTELRETAAETTSASDEKQHLSHELQKYTEAEKAWEPTALAPVIRGIGVDSL